MKTINRPHNRMAVAIAIVLCFIGSVCWTSCTKESGNTDLPLANPYDAIGQQHNEGLAFVFSQIQKAPRTKTGMPNINQSLIQEFCNQYLSQNQSKAIETSNHYRYPKNASDLNSMNFSDLQISYMKELENILKHYKGYFCDNLNRDIVALEYRITNDPTLSQNEKNTLLCGTAVGRYSSDYWTKNFKLWAIEINNQKYATTRADADSSGIWSIIGTDAFGAAVGWFTGVGAAAFGLGASAVACYDSLMRD